MVVRLEEVRNSDTILVIDENNKYLGTMFYSDFADCIDSTKNEFEEDEYLYWFVDKEILNKTLTE